MCGHVTRTYKRRLPVADLWTLVKLYRLGGWVHIRDLQGKSGGGDFAKLRFWGLIAEQDQHDPETRTSGVWRITLTGEAWIEGKILIPSHVVLRNGKRIELIGDLWSFREAVRRGGFDFQELMRREGGTLA
jgi:hypothetical protein